MSLERVLEPLLRQGATVAVRRWTYVVGLVAIALGIVLGVRIKHRLGIEEKTAAHDSLRAVKLAMKWTYAGTMAPYFAAQKNGVFAGQGLSVSMTEGGPGFPSSIQQVLLGTADFGITGAHELAIARSQDQPVVSIAVIFKVSPVCLISMSDRGIRRPRDLIGKTVEMTSGDDAEFQYLAMLQKQGVDTASVKREPFMYNYAGFLSGRTDAAVVYENDQAITLRADIASLGKTPALLCPRDYGVTPYGDVLFTLESTLQDSELVRRVVTGVLESWEWAARNRSETVTLFMADPRIADREWNKDELLSVLAKSLEFVRANEEVVGEHINRIGLQEARRWQETVDLIQLYGYAEKLPTVESLFTNRWVQLHQMSMNGRTSKEGDRNQR